MQQKNNSNQIYKGFIQGSLGAVIGSTVAHPIDLIKVRMQLSNKNNGSKINILNVSNNIIKSEGFSGFLKGIDASIIRQFTYSGTRFGVYDILKKNVKKDTNEIPFLTKVICAGISGCIGALIANPCDLVLVRMQANNNLKENKINENFCKKFFNIAKSEGIFNMWKNGLFPNINRAMIVTTGQLAMYDQFKEKIIKYGGNDCIYTHFTASFIAAFTTSFISNPIDVSKTRLMNQNQNKKQYTSMLNCFSKIIKNEGVLSLYNGFTANFARQCPYLVVTWITIEQLKSLMKDY